MWRISTFCVTLPFLFVHNVKCRMLKHKQLFESRKKSLEFNKLYLVRKGNDILCLTEIIFFIESKISLQK